MFTAATGLIQTKPVKIITTYFFHTQFNNNLVLNLRPSSNVSLLPAHQAMFFKHLSYPHPRDLCPPQFDKHNVTSESEAT